MTSAKYGIIGVLFFLCFSFMGLSAQGISVTAPAAGAQVCKGKATVITWMKSGNTDPTVKIRLYDRTVSSKLLDIADAVPNSGSFTWTVPNSLPDGQYVVRVRTLGEGIADDSGVFTIKTCGVQSALDRGVQKKPLPETVSVEGSGLKMADFEIIDIERETGSGVIYAKLINKGSGAYNGPLTFRVMFGSDTLDPMKVPVNIAAGATQMVNLMYYLQPREMVVRKTVQIRVKVDSDNKVAELNEQNNEFSRTVSRTCPIYIDSLTVEVTPSHSFGPYPLAVNISINLRYVGQGQLKVMWNAINNSVGDKTLTLDGSGNYSFNDNSLEVRETWLAPHPQKVGCQNEYAHCPIIRAWVVNPSPESGMRESNRVHARYEKR